MQSTRRHINAQTYTCCIANCPIDDSILDCWLAESYGIRDVAFRPLNLGHASETWTYRTDPARYFIKIKRSGSAVGAAIPACLAAKAMPALAPVPSLNGDLIVEREGLHLLVFPFLDAQPVDFARLSGESWRELGALLRHIHTTTLPAIFQQRLPRLSFEPCDEEVLVGLDEAAQSSHWPSEDARQAAQLWRDKREDVASAIEGARQQGILARKQSDTRRCLCHGDFQQGNILRDSKGAWTIIDWEDSVYAPPERDLMHIPRRFRPAFAAGYGTLPENTATETYLHMEWRLNELLDCASRLLLYPEATRQKRAWALDYFRRLLHAAHEAG